MTTPTPIEAGARADLLPCPFCGEQKIFFNPPDKARGWKGSINCPACLVTMPREASDDELIRCWNTRAGSPATAVAEMRERCAKVAELAGCGNQKCMACYGNQIAAMIRDLSPAGGDYVVVRKSDLTELTRICNGAEHDAKYAARRLSGGEQQRFLTDKQRGLPICCRPRNDAGSSGLSVDSVLPSFRSQEG